MKTTMKFFLVIALFSSVTLADEGNMGTGNRNCTQQQPCLVAEQDEKNNDDEKGVFEFLQEYLLKIFE